MLSGKHLRETWEAGECSIFFAVFIFIGLSCLYCEGNPLSANPAKWSNTIMQFYTLPTNCLSMFDYFVGLAFKGLVKVMIVFKYIQINIFLLTINYCIFIFLSLPGISDIDCE